MKTLVATKLNDLSEKHELGGFRGIATRLGCSHMTVYRAMAGGPISPLTQDQLGQLFPTEAPGEVWAQLNAIDCLTEIRNRKIENQIVPIL